MRGASTGKGFTLLEVVVGLAILGLGVGLALELFSGGLNNLHRVDMAHRAMFHAENIMNEMLADESVTQPTARSGDLDEEFGYNVVVDYWQPPEEPLLQLETDQPGPELLSVVVEVVFKNDPNGKRYRVASLKTVMPDLGPAGLNPGGVSDALRQLFRRNQ